MTINYRKVHTDGNHWEVVGWYEQLGCSVRDCSAFGGGFPDITVGCTGVTDLVEIKMADGKLRASQIKFNEGWRGALPVVVRTFEEVHAHVIDMRKRALQGVRRG